MGCMLFYGVYVGGMRGMLVCDKFLSLSLSSFFVDEGLLV